MIDFHSHILPEIDDGSSSVEESIALLRLLRDQGVSCVCATPHFDAISDTPSAFIKRRDSAYRRLLRVIGTKEPPCIILGSEVMYFPGICNMSTLDSLCFEGSKYLLLEMQERPWSDYTVDELVRLTLSGKIKLVLAHIERYLPFQRAHTFDKLRSFGVLMQSNASFFINKKTRRTALSMLKKGEINFLGTDCHNLLTRPPRYNEAMEIIRGKFGNKFKLNILDKVSSRLSVEQK